MPPFSPFLPEGLDPPEKTRKDFSFYKQALEKYGVESGTAHKRILIPKYDLTREELEKQLGFIPVKIAIPEAGQASYTSLRNPDNPYHIHEFEKYWTMHRDEFAASTMLAHKKIEAGGHPIWSQVTSFFSGLPHIVTEGLPGLYYYTKGMISDVPSMDLRLLSELPEQYLRKMSGRDDPYNTIQGFPEQGMASELRKRNTDFGSGYQGENKEENPFLIPLSAGFGFGAAGLFYRSVFTPWGKEDLSRYERLLSLRQTGEKYGFRMLSSSIPEFFDERLPISNARDLGLRAAGYTLYGEMDPTRHIGNLQGFSGVTYLQSGEWAQSQFPISTKVANWGNWEIGADKLATWEYFNQKGKGFLHAKTIGASEFYREGKLREAGRQFIEEVGGLENIVVKKRSAARGTGVWLDAAELPSDVAERMFRSPGEFLLQQRLNLDEEFRVVTVGDKPIHTTYRFGSKTLRKIGKFFGVTPTKEKLGLEKVAQVSPFEVIQPVWDKTYKAELEKFAETVSRELPYEIGALDIGRTKEGKFVLIEAQRSFGNISNPIVSRRIKQIITGKAGPGAIIASAALGVLGAGIAYNLFSGKKDAGNTIEGLPEKGWAAELRKEGTDFGSPWGSTWKGWFGGISRKISKYMASGAREGAAPLLHPAEAFELSKGKSLQEFALSLKQRLGLDISIVGQSQAEQQAFQQMVQQAPGLAGGAASLTFASGKEVIVMNPAVLKETFLKTATGHTKITQETALKAVESEAFQKSVLYHEVLERQSAARFSYMKKMPAHHNAAQVIIGEGGFIRMTGDKNLENLMTSVRGLRSEEIKALSAGFEAFGETGVNAKLRKLTTDFGEYRNSAQIVKQNIIGRKIRFNRTAETLKRSQYMIWNNAKYGGKNHTFQQGK